LAPFPPTSPTSVRPISSNQRTASICGILELTTCLMVTNLGQ
jgi:hypothetical protein